MFEARELSASSRIIEAYPRPPTFKPADTRSSKRRSVDSTMLLGNMEDISPEDPMFVLRRAVAYRHSTSRNRLSASLDEIALQKFHRESVSSSASDATIPAEDSKRQQSQKEIIAAQRAATRATQRAILSTQSNASHGVDVLLPGNAMIRSSRYEVDERTRYSYIDADGETYDVSDIIEEELNNDPQHTGGTDLLQSVKEVPSDKLDRVLNKIKDGKGNGKLPSSQASDSLHSKRSSSPSLYSYAERESIVQDNAQTPRTNTPLASAMNPRNQMSTTVSNRTASPLARFAANNSKYSAIHERQNSIASMLSDLQSGYRSPTPGTPPHQPIRSGSVLRRPKPFIPKDDFGLSNMLAVIELGGSAKAPTPAPSDFVEEFFFGKRMDAEALHPAVQEIYADSFKQLEAMDAVSSPPMIVPDSTRVLTPLLPHRYRSWTSCLPQQVTHSFGIHRFRMRVYLLFIAQSITLLLHFLPLPSVRGILIITSNSLCLSSIIIDNLFNATGLLIFTILLCTRIK